MFFLFQQQLLNDKAQEEGDTITNLKVQKLLYYAQAYSLLYYNKPLFDEKIEACPHGPVVKEVFNEIKKEIGENGCKNLGDIWHLTKENFKLNDDDMDILLNVWNKYGNYTASRLRNMTHDEEPYLTAYVESQNNEITQASIKAYFDKKLKQEAQGKRGFYGIDRLELLRILQEIFRLSDDEYNLLLENKAVFDKLSPLTKQKELDIEQLEKMCKNGICKFTDILIETILIKF